MVSNVYNLYFEDAGFGEENFLWKQEVSDAAGCGAM
jgi:hypothetical protein